MQRLAIRVVRGRNYHPGDGFTVFGDGGRGAIDWDQPLTTRKTLFWEGASPVAGLLEGGHLAERHLNGILPDRHLYGTFLLDAHLQPAALITWHSDPYVFGRFRMAVVTEDAVGHRHVEDAAVCEHVVHSAPPPARSLRPAVFDASYGCMTFAFQAAERLIG